jgi:monooxygenase
MTQMTEHFDVLIVGAGLSGIGAAHHLQKHCPKKTFLIVEGRKALGGTWDLFRYPGIRSDSDMHTMGFSFRPWTEKKAIAEGATILNYLNETAKEYGIDRHIRYSHRVVQVRWSSEQARWTVEMESGPSRERTTCTCSFLFMCTGYYNYDQGHTPQFPGADRFRGRIVHPQQWPADLDYAGKRVVIIGSGATAVTLVPSLAKTAAHVTMLQRSPSYIFARPGSDPMVVSLKRFLPERWASRLARWKNILIGMYYYRIARSQPEKFSALLIGGAKAHLGADYDVATHFTPKYKPWDQRLCLAPDGDLFKTIREGDASIVTDSIDSFTEGGIKLASGKELLADVIVTATGLKLQLISGVEIYVDDVRVEMSKTFNYKGTMFSGIPNFALTIGYTNASWTLKAELSSLYVCRLLNYMDRHGWRTAVPHLVEGSVGEQPMITLASGYIQREIDQLPKQGLKKPWTLRQNYPRDMISLRYGRLDDGAMRFSR